MKEKKKNQGLSLIEVIVSMLILAIIVVPMLSSFVLSSRINLKSRMKQYATRVATNVAEGIKAYGLEQTAMQFNAVPGYGFQIIPTSLLSNSNHGVGFFETNVFNGTKVFTVGDGAPIVDNAGTYTFQDLASDSYFFNINGIKEGTKLFDVRVSITADANYNGNGVIQQNQFPIPDVSNLDMDNTVLINPNSTFINFKTDINGFIVNNGAYQTDTFYTYDDRAVMYFADKNEDYVMDLYRQALADANANGSTPPNLSDYLAMCKTSDELKRHITRTTKIVLTNPSGKISVSCDLIYQFYDPASIIKDEYKVKEYHGIVNSQSFDQLKNIYIFQVPLSWNCIKEDIPNGIYTDLITVDKTALPTSMNDINIFVAKQVSSVPVAITADIYIKTLPNEDGFKFYYKPSAATDELHWAGSNDVLKATNYSKELVADGEAKKRIYNLKVQVFEAGTNQKVEEVISTITR